MVNSYPNLRIFGNIIESNAVGIGRKRREDIISNITTNFSLPVRCGDHKKKLRSWSEVFKHFSEEHSEKAGNSGKSSLKNYKWTVGGESCNSPHVAFVQASRLMADQGVVSITFRFSIMSL